MIKRVPLIFFILYLILPINESYSSFSDQALFQIGKSRILIRWESDDKDLGDLNNFFDVINLVAHNYETIKNQNQTFFLECFKEDNSNYVLYDDTSSDKFHSYNNIYSVKKALIEKIKKSFRLAGSVPDFFNIILLAIPPDKDGENSPDHDRYSEFYYGAAPGIMQIVEGKRLYYQYFFFKEDNLIKIIKQEPNFKGVIIRKKITRKNINRMFSLDL